MQKLPGNDSLTVAFVTLGCKTNQFESAAMQEQLMAAGYRIVQFEDGADLVIVNTCTVTSATDAQSRNLIRRAHRQNANCRIIVTGCYAQIDPQTLAQIPGVSVIIGNSEKHALLTYLQEINSTKKVNVSNIRVQKTICLTPLTSFTGRSRAFVQVQNGCDAFCSYCIIPYARGASRSARIQDVVMQVQKLVEAGYPEIVLTGIHIGGYGKDLNPKTDLVSLLKQLLADTDVQRLRLGSIEPNEIPDSLISMMAGSSVICHHWHIPLQAGDDSVLKRMRRTYDSKFFHDLIVKIYTQMPHAGIGLDVITGFPGETEDEFKNTFELIEALPVSYLHVFPFSKRAGTPAANLSGQIPPHQIKERAEQIRKLGIEKQATFARKFIGQDVEVIVESGRHNGLLKGVTRNYLDVYFKGDERRSGTKAIVKIYAYDNGILRGNLLDKT